MSIKRNNTSFSNLSVESKKSNSCMSCFRYHDVGSVLSKALRNYDRTFLLDFNRAIVKAKASGWFLLWLNLNEKSFRLRFFSLGTNCMLNKSKI